MRHAAPSTPHDPGCAFTPSSASQSASVQTKIVPSKQKRAPSDVYEIASPSNILVPVAFDDSVALGLRALNLCLWSSLALRSSVKGALVAEESCSAISRRVLSAPDPRRRRVYKYFLSLRARWISHPISPLRRSTDAPSPRRRTPHPRAPLSIYGRILSRRGVSQASPPPLHHPQPQRAWSGDGIRSPPDNSYQQRGIGFGSGVGDYFSGLGARDGMVSGVRHHPGDKAGL